MLQKIDTMLLMKKMQLQEKLENFLKEERGASDMAAVMVLIVIVVALAGVFNDKLKTAVQKSVEKLTTFIESTS